MMLMPANNSSGIVHYLAGKHPGRIGWLNSPSSWKHPRFYLPYALDNDAFTAYSKNQEWDVLKWREMLVKSRMSLQKPIWVLVPDVVANRPATLENWKRYSPEVHALGWPMAFAVQDGMSPDDVPQEASVVFVGGTTEWKWKSLPMWSRSGKPIHVGRVNEIRRLWICEEYGVQSVDGTGWFRGTTEGRQAKQILQWIEGNNQETPYFESLKDFDCSAKETILKKEP